MQTKEEFIQALEEASRELSKAAAELDRKEQVILELQREALARKALLASCKEWIVGARDEVLSPVSHGMFTDQAAHNADGLGQASVGLLSQLDYGPAPFKLPECSTERGGHFYQGWNALLEQLAHQLGMPAPEPKHRPYPKRKG